MAISKVASHRLLCCVPTLYVYMSKCYFINVKRKHEDSYLTDCKSIPQAVKLSKILIILIAQFQYPPL